MSYSGTLIIEQAIQPRHKGLGACPTYLPSILRPEHGNVPDIAQHPGNFRCERALKYTAKAAASGPNAVVIAETEQKKTGPPTEGLSNSIQANCALEACSRPQEVCPAEDVIQCWEGVRLLLVVTQDWWALVKQVVDTTGQGQVVIDLIRT